MDQQLIDRIAAAIPRHQQAFRHKPDEGQVGDCYRTCVACILGIERDAVPHPHRLTDENFSQVAAMREWLLSRGQALTLIPFKASPDEVLMTMERFAPATPFIMTAMSANRVGHCVVCLGGRIIHDPSIDQSGIIGPDEDGWVWVEVISPLPAGAALAAAA
jgi:hypothetical protein